MNLAAFQVALDQYVKPLTQPVGVKMLKSGEDLPAKAKVPSKDFRKRLAICQANTLARKFGWVLALGAEDHSCPIGSVVLGFQEALPFYTEGNLAAGMYTKDLEAGKRSEEAVRRFDYQKYSTIIIGALGRLSIEPDLIAVYGNAAQVMRLLHASLYEEGGSINSSFTGRGECSEFIVQTMESDQCQVVLPGNGERVFGQTQDEEMAFTIPASKVDSVTLGLEMTHKGGVRYPIPNYALYEAKFPPKYLELEKMW